MFDLDGTLVDSEPNYFAASQKLFAEHGWVFDEAMNQRYVGISTKEMLEDIRKNYPEYLFQDSIEALVEKKIAITWK
ncbi:HAD hydrolase-like protein [Laceyella putida]|uniref:HAD hydrolase-like protein n=1 Tax=Laceyella putida TaxID=110101 RepID=A0ABW2RFG8_9BACL